MNTAVFSGRTPRTSSGWAAYEGRCTEPGSLPEHADGILAAKEETLNNERQIGLAIQAKNSMEAVQASLEAGDEIDLVTVDLQNAWYALKEITGEAGREDLLDEIFSRFCLGK